MSTLKNAGKPATTPRAASASPWYQATCPDCDCITRINIDDPFLTESANVVCFCGRKMDLSEFGIPRFSKALTKPGLVTEPAGQVEAGVTKEEWVECVQCGSKYTMHIAKVGWERCQDCGGHLMYVDDTVINHRLAEAGVTKCNEDGCISPPTFTCLRIFTSWDDVDKCIQTLLNAINRHDRWDISRWRFMDDHPNNGWINELCYVPQRSFIEVEWGFINV
jgi:hypothetical protein